MGRGRAQTQHVHVARTLAQERASVAQRVVLDARWNMGKVGSLSSLFFHL